MDYHMETISSLASDAHEERSPVAGTMTPERPIFLNELSFFAMDHLALGTRCKLITACK